MLNLIEDHGKVAVIDIGSNSLRFVIFDRYGRYPYPLFNERITCRLGDGVQKTKKLKKERIEQSLETIMRFSNIISEAGLEKVLVIGTAALRHPGCHLGYIRLQTQRWWRAKEQEAS